MLSVLGTAMASAALLGGQAAAPQEIVPPTWASVPGAYDMADAYPMFASMAELHGDVTLRCTVIPDGTLARCGVVRALPEGVGFEQAALRLAGRFRANPLEVAGDPEKSEVEFTIRFRLPDDAPLPWRGPEPTPEHLAMARTLVAQMRPPEDNETETMALDVAPEREAKVRAMVLQAEAEFEPRFEEAAALSIARLTTPEQLSNALAGRSYPPRPSEDLLTRSFDVGEQLVIDSGRRLNALYCAQFACPVLAPPPANSVNADD